MLVRHAELSCKIYFILVCLVVVKVDTEANYYQFLADYVPSEMNFLKVRKINIVIDESALEETGAQLRDLSVQMGVA